VSSWAVLIALMVLMGGVVLWLFTSMVRSIQDERRSSGVKKIWKNFGLSIGFAGLFLLSWLGQGVAQWNHYADEQKEHDQPTEVRGFISDFSASTLENWQSEFLQLFSFVVMSALMIHRGSAESKDSEERIEEIVRRIEKKLDDAAPAGSRKR
jgi:hypothetical protein